MAQQINYTQMNDVWYEELGRTTLASPSSTLVVSSLPNRKHLRVIVRFGTTGGTRGMALQFNGDGSSSYAQRTCFNGTDSSAGATDSAGTGGGVFTPPCVYVADIYNVASVEKTIVYQLMTSSTTGASNAPDSGYGSGKWANTSDVISSIQLKDVGTGQFDTGSELIVLGHD